MNHRTKFWWACPACLEEKTRDADEYVRNWATRRLNLLKEELGGISAGGPHD